MKNYSNSVPGHVIKRFQKWLMIGLLFLLLIIFVVIVSVAIWFFYQQNETSDHPVSRGETTTNNPYKTFKTKYFQFRADKSWKYIPSESSADSFVYRSYKNNLVLRDITVYVDSLPSNLLLTRILPVKAKTSKLVAGETSGHCKEALPSDHPSSDRNPVSVNLKGISFTCQVDNDQTVAGIGVSNNGLGADLIRDNGDKTNYFLLYHDLEFTPKTSAFEDIVDEFRAI